VDLPAPEAPGLYKSQDYSLPPFCVAPNESVGVQLPVSAFTSMMPAIFLLYQIRAKLLDFTIIYFTIISSIFIFIVVRSYFSYSFLLFI